MSRRVKLTGFIALTIAMFMGMLDSTIVNIALPDITNYFHSELNDTSWISTVYVMGLAVLSITASKLADQYGRKKFMIIGLVLFGGSSALCGLSQTLPSLIMFRLLQSAGGSIVTPLVMPMGMEIFGKEKLHPVASAVGAITALAAAGGPPIGGLLIKYVNWQAIFFVNVPFAVISLVLILFFVGESYDRTVSKSIDGLGMFLLTAALFMLTFALLKGNDYGWSSTLILSMLAGSAVVTVLFIITELKVKAPMLELHLFRESTFAMSAVCNLVTCFGMACPVLIFSYFLQDALGYDALKAALIIMPVALTVIVSMPLGTAISSKFGAKPVNFLGILGLAGGIFMLSRVKVNTSNHLMVLIMIVCGLGLGFACQAIISAVKHLPVEKSGVGSGVVNAARQVGICLGIAILVSFLDNGVTTATNTIKTDAIATVQQSGIVSPVKTVMIDDISKDLSTGNGTRNLQQADLQNELQNDIQKSIDTVSSAPRPADENLAKLYDAASSISSGAAKASDGQKSLNSSISSLDSGLSGLYDGSRSLASGAKALDSGVSQAVAGSQKLASGSQKIGSLASSLDSLTNGAKKLAMGLSELFSQLSPTKSGNTTLKDKINALNAGAKSYVGASSAVMGALRGNSAVYTDIYNSLAAAFAKGNVAGISGLVTALVLVTDINDASQLAKTVGTLKAIGVSADKAYITEQQAAYDNGGTSLTSAIDTLDAQTNPGTGGAATLYDQLAALNNGAQAVSSGAQALSGGASRLVELQSGFDSLMKALDQLKASSSQLVTGSQNLQDGISSAKSGSGKLADGSAQLADASSQISSGASRLASGIGFAGQKSEIMDVVNRIKADKDSNVAIPFNRTFLLASIVLAVTSIFGLFTDKKAEKQTV